MTQTSSNNNAIPISSQPKLATNRFRASWIRHGSVWGMSWSVFEASWKHLGGVLGRLGGVVGASWGCPEGVLGRIVVPWGRLGGIEGAY